MEAIVSAIDLKSATELGIIALVCGGFLLIVREQVRGVQSLVESSQAHLAEICNAHGALAQQAIMGYQELNATMRELREAFEQFVDDRESARR